MTGHNDITGNSLISKPISKEYELGWERVFNKEKQVGFIQHSMFVQDDKEREQVILELEEDKTETFFDIEENESGQVLWKQRV